MPYSSDIPTFAPAGSRRDLLRAGAAMGAFGASALWGMPAFAQRAKPLQGTTLNVALSAPPTPSCCGPGSPNSRKARARA